MENLLAGRRGTAPAYPVYISELGTEECRIVQDYCLAVRSALTDDGQPPLCASGLRLHDRLSAVATSLQRAVETAQKGGITGVWRSRWSGSSGPSNVA
jgi:hypothetical protein